MSLSANTLKDVLLPYRGVFLRMWPANVVKARNPRATEEQLERLIGGWVAGREFGGDVSQLQGRRRSQLQPHSASCKRCPQPTDPRT